MTMVVLRFVLLFLGLLSLPSGALARTDFDEMLPAIAALSQEGLALSRVLDKATDAGDPIEASVLSGVRSFYEGRRFEPLWIEGGKPTRQMSALRTLLDRATVYGLDASLYQTPDYAASYPDDDERVALVDVEFSQAVARFVTHVGSGRIEPTVISPLITLTPERPNISDALTRLSRSSAVAVELGRFEPPHAQYKALRAALSKLRAMPSDEDRIVVPEGDLLKPGMSDARVPLLRARLGLSLQPDANPEVYDEMLVEAVQLAQAEHELKPDGVVGPRTLLALNGRSRAEDIASVLANLERWRWMPRDLGSFHVIVNIPEFMVRVFDHGNLVHQTRVVVGKPNNPTPTFSHVMSHLIVNPYWNVPASIVRNEMMPQVRSNPGFFSRGGYQVFALVGGRYRQINPYWVNWHMVSPRQIQVRQIPGDFNALGRIKFMFPNQHDVYLHDTPSKKLFERDVRALSHGCVRVDQPLAFADAILPVAAPDWNSSRLKDLYGKSERLVKFETPIPVHLSYFTAAVGPDRQLRVFDDIYGYDARMAEYLGS
jgi:murein L,D-transpeptidase YcbB/YkuD